jgi:hypothetical protein
VQWSANAAVEHIPDKKVSFDGSYHLVGDDVLKTASTAWKKKRDGAAKVGTERHGRLEEWIRMCLEHSEGRPLAGGDDVRWGSIRPFLDWSLANVDRFLFTEANAFSRRLHIGGIADLGLMLKDGGRLVADHKSSKAAYFNQFIQTALYDLQLSENGGHGAEGNKLFDWKPADGYIIFPFRSSPFTPEVRWDAEELRAAAEGLVKLYKLSEFGETVRM